MLSEESNKKTNGVDMSKDNPSIKFLASESLINSMTKVRCGFELEFQAMNNIDQNGPIYDKDKVPNEEKLRGAFIANYNFKEVIRNSPEWLRNIYGNNSGILNHTKEELSDIFAGDLLERIESLVERAESRYYDHWRSQEIQSSPSLYYDKPQRIKDVYVRHVLAELGDDGSVKGGEIRTLGALRPTQFLSLTKHMFDNHDLTIDNNCSFHIHLSVDGVKHVYGQQTQAEMSAYLLKNIDEFPKSVQDRLRTDATRWCEARVSTEKYTFINYNADFCTWEFRLWGNIDNYQDAKKALFLSIRALKHAYRVKTGISKPILRKTEYSHLSLIMREGLKRMTLRAVRLKNKYIWNLIKQAA
jgi:hypothetical protein